MSKKKCVTKLAYTVFCCGGSDCSKEGGKEIAKELRREVREAGMKDSVHFLKTECTGRCKDAPVFIVCNGCNFATGKACGAVWYRKLKPRDVPQLVQDHLQNGHPLEDRMFQPQDESD
jgi:(2Fe-2S) ferredoxin